eukprot:scaffold1503_cov250-Pinguiococcus_pyrenoidosus.AAC.21
MQQPREDVDDRRAKHGASKAHHDSDVGQLTRQRGDERQKAHNHTHALNFRRALASADQGEDAVPGADEVQGIREEDGEADRCPADVQQRVGGVGSAGDEGSPHHCVKSLHRGILKLQEEAWSIEVGVVSGAQHGKQHEGLGAEHAASRHAKAWLHGEGVGQKLPSKGVAPIKGAEHDRKNGVHRPCHALKSTNGTNGTNGTSE